MNRHLLCFIEIYFNNTYVYCVLCMGLYFSFHHHHFYFLVVPSNEILYLTLHCTLLLRLVIEVVFILIFCFCLPSSANIRCQVFILTHLYLSNWHVEDWCYWPKQQQQQPKQENIFICKRMKWNIWIHKMKSRLSSYRIVWLKLNIYVYL